MIVAVAGLLVTLAALLDGGRGGTPELPPVRVTLTVPEGLLFASGVIFAVAWLLIMVAARARRKPDDDPESRASSWRQAIAPVIALMPVIAAVVILWLDGGRIAGALLAIGQGWFGGGATSPAEAERVELALPWLGWSVGLLSLAIALVMLAIAVLLLFGDRIIAWWMDRRARTERAEIVAVVDESLDDLVDGPDPRVAIINCYRRFEHATARAQVRRAPWQTVDEFMREALVRLALPAPAVERLTRLFEVARFSRRPIGDAERDSARACLEEIRHSLEPAGDAVGVA